MGGSCLCLAPQVFLSLPPLGQWEAGTASHFDSLGCGAAGVQLQRGRQLPSSKAGENQEGELTRDQKKQLDRRLNHGDVLPREREGDERGEVLEEQGKAGKEGSDDETSLFP